MQNIKKIHNRQNSQSYIAEKYVVGSNALKIAENVYQNDCSIVDFRDHYFDKTHNSPELKHSRKVMSKSKIFVYVLFAVFGITFGSVVAYATTPTTYKTVEYQIQAGDSLWDIASESNYGADIEETIYEIKKINNLNSENIRAGQTILVPSK
ncbi:LysM peptidoglycan-binding domain-containing protein [Actinomyces sp. zg-332]|uniref:cell division suppressor protein YneA n=1 Tax=Actinomyces sp. zg-332 TaxID=2708340 RepID=UPI001420AA25|nr:LysM peptidoglycan-binding domain-containing protein [Actinomyces sp. zg-332]QPK94411.1 LysM peptidoglycan-binding domain-containing protein [Actinomyces sp. zg-332]